MDKAEFVGLRLSVVRNEDSSFKALVGQSKAYFATVPFDVVATVGEQGYFAFSMSTANLNMRTLVCVFFDKSAGCSSVPLVPDPLMQLLAGLSFTEVGVSYDNSKEAGKQLAVIAVPDMSKVPLLGDIMGFMETTFGLSFSPKDIMLKLSPGEPIAFGIFKSFTMSLGAPFTEPVQTTASLEVVGSGVSLGVKAQLAFDSTIKLPGVQDAVGFNVLATVAMNPDLSFGFAGRTTTTVVLSMFKFIQIKEFAVAAEFSVSPFMLNMLKLQGEIQIFDVAGSGAFLWDRNTGDLAFKGEVANVDLQDLLKEWGIDLDLGVWVGGEGDR